MTRCGVYSITHNETGRMYVGKTVDFDRRWMEHKKLASSRRKGIHGAMKKYGFAAFSFDVLEFCDSEASATSAELFWIEWYASKAPNGFNLTDGGEGASGRTLSEETRAKISAANKSRPREVIERIASANRGKRHTEEHRAKISAAGRGRKHSDETKAKIAAASAQHRHSDDTKAKIGRVHKGWAERRRVRSGQCELDL